MKKILLGTLVCGMALGLAACGDNSSKNSSDSSDSTQSSKTVTSSSSSQVSSNSGSTTSSSESSTSTKLVNVDNKTAGTMLCLLWSPDWFKENLQGGVMSYGTDGSKITSKAAGYDYITANGDPMSYIYFKRNGNNIDYMYWVEGPEGVADGHFVNKSISLAQLEKDYYVTQSQKDEVNGYASQLKGSDY